MPIELGEGMLYVPDGHGGWTDIGRTDGGVRLEVDPPDDRAALISEGWLGLSATVTVNLDVTAFEAAWTAAGGTLHDLSAAWRPRAHIRCRRCHPAANPRPLPIDGYEYRRRQRARKRKGR